MLPGLQVRNHRVSVPNFLKQVGDFQFVGVGVLAFCKDFGTSVAAKVSETAFERIE